VEERNERSEFDLIIIGAGPAGLTAAIYAARAALSTLVVDESSAGGQVRTTHRVSNYPGFVEPVEGRRLAANMRDQALKYGAVLELVTDITRIHLEADEKWLELDDGGIYAADHVIIATGSSPMLLNIPGEKEYRGNGVSYCATCDGEFFRDGEIVVVGGGNSAMEESLLLLQYVRSITVIHQFDELQAEKITAERVTGHPGVDIYWSHEPRRFRKDGQRMVVEAENLKTGARVELERDGVFVFVGMQPNSGFLEGTRVRLTEGGYISTNERMETSIEGVYAAGDIRDKRHRQIATAVGDGAVASLEVIRKM
jgi:thioredoxin reductase (NADPH)